MELRQKAWLHILRQSLKITARITGIPHYVDNCSHGTTKSVKVMNKALKIAYLNYISI